MSVDTRADLPSLDQRACAARVGMELALWARHTPDVVAVITAAGNRTFCELNRNANRLVRALRAAELRPGDAVAIISTNRAELVEVFYACRRAGLCCVPINPLFDPEEAAYVVNDCGAKALIADCRLGTRLGRLVELSPDVRLRLAIGGDIPGFDSYQETIEACDAADITEPLLGSFMPYVMGSYGPPFGVARTRAAFEASTLPLLDAADYGPERGQLHLCTTPLSHWAALAFSLLQPLAAGVGVVLMERWDAEDALRSIARHRVTHAHMLPAMCHQFLLLPQHTRATHDLSSLAYLLHGSAICGLALKHAMLEQFGPIVWEYFGSAEGLGTVVSPAEWLRKPGTVGKPHSVDHLLILDHSGKPCAKGVGDVDRLYIKIPEGGFEYHKRPEQTAEACDGNYYTLGDIGRLDDDGYLFLTEHGRDVISGLPSALGVRLAEVESVLYQHPEVVEAVVIDVPGVTSYEELKAVVVVGSVPPRLERGHVAWDELLEISSDWEAGRALKEELMAHCKRRLAAFKCPASIELVAQLPRTPIGRVKTRAVREHYRAKALAQCAKLY